MMRPSTWRALVPAGFLLLGAASACQVAPPSVPPDVAAQVGQVEAPGNERLLLYPTGDPESLLGREIQLSRDGGFTIADARAPGCEVSVRRTKSQYEREYKADMKQVAVLSGGYAEILGITARYGTSIQARALVKNVEILSADLRGPCGTNVLDSILVGSGERSLVRSAEAGVEAGAQISAIPLSTKDGSETTVAGRVAWQEPQGYAFTVKKLDAAQALQLDVVMPDRLVEGSELELEVKSNLAAHLIVYFLEEDGQGGVLYPSNEVPDTRIAAGGSIRFPKLRPALRTPGKAAHETLVIYAFAEKGDFSTLKPPPGSHQRAGAAYAAELTSKLNAIPMRRWARTTVSYVIEPGAATGP